MPLNVLIVSLARDTARREKIASALSDPRVSYQFVDAVYGKHLPQQVLDGINTVAAARRRTRAISLNEIGCALSHQKTWQTMIDNHCGWVCILEDDAVLDRRFTQFIVNFDSAALAGYEQDLLLLGGQNGTFRSQYIARSRWKSLRIGGQEFRKTVNSEWCIYRTCCYLVSESLARRLLALSGKHFFVADEWDYLKKMGAIRHIYLADFVDHPLDLTDSHIESERNLRQPEISPKRRLLRKVRSGALHLKRVVLKNIHSFF